MPSIFETAQFVACTKRLTKKPKEGYTSLSADINDYFKNKSINELRVFGGHKSVLRNEETFFIFKERLPNSGKLLGSSSGFRLIFFVSKTKNDVYLLYVYPKAGNQGQSNLKKGAVEYLVEQLAKDIKENAITEFSPLPKEREKIEE